MNEDILKILLSESSNSILALIKLIKSVFKLGLNSRPPKNLTNFKSMTVNQIWPSKTPLGQTEQNVLTVSLFKLKLEVLRKPL